MRFAGFRWFPLAPLVLVAVTLLGWAAASLGGARPEDGDVTAAVPGDTGNGDGQLAGSPPPPERFPPSGRDGRVSRQGALPRLPQAPGMSPTTVIPAGGAWAALRQCESGGDYQADTGNGYYGAYQISAATWRSLGYDGLPHEAPPSVQDEAARRLQDRLGWRQWPACSKQLGLR